MRQWNTPLPFAFIAHSHSSYHSTGYMNALLLILCLFATTFMNVNAEWTCPGNVDLTEDLLSRSCPDYAAGIRACCSTYDGCSTCSKDLCSCLLQATQYSACRDHVELGVCGNELQPGY